MRYYLEKETTTTKCRISVLLALLAVVPPLFKQTAFAPVQQSERLSSVKHTLALFSDDGFWVMESPVGL